MRVEEAASRPLAVRQHNSPLKKYKKLLYIQKDRTEDVRDCRKHPFLQ